MAKAKKRGASRKKSSKRDKASAKPAHKKVAKRTTPKKTKPKVRRAGRSAPKPKAKKKQPLKIAARQAAEVPVETTIIDVIEEPVPGVVVVTEYESVRTGTPISPGPLPKRGKGTEPGTEEQ